MNKLKKMLAAVTAMVFSAGVATFGTASAENAKAAELREIIQSNHYYVEYEVNRKEDKRALAVDGDRKMSYDCEGRRGATIFQFVPIVGMFAKGSLKLMPEVYYENDQYYQFIEKKKALRASTDELNDPYLNPNQEWSTIPRRIVLPEEFGMFTNDKDITFVDSDEKIIDEKKGTKASFDKYVKQIKNVAGVNIAKKVYMVEYDDKENISAIYTLTVDWNEDAETIFDEEWTKDFNKQGYNLQRIKINKFTGELPDNAMKFTSGCKVYGPGLGDMNELLDKLPLLEEH